MSSQRRDDTQELVAAPSMFRHEWAMSRGWHQLEIVHMPFRATEAREYRDLIARLASLEQLFLASPSLRWYHAESHLGESGSDRSSKNSDREPAAVLHVAAMQAQLMEDVFYVLQLDRFANAPDNRGWMNLFRRWGRSETFTRAFEQIRDTLTVDFLSFYDLYVANWPETIDERPVPHAWDPLHLRRRTPRRTDDDERVRTITAEREGEILPGVYLDGGRSATAPATRAQPQENTVAPGETGGGGRSGTPNE